jgi:hypothetical protein
MKSFAFLLLLAAANLLAASLPQIERRGDKASLLVDASRSSSWARR